MTSKFASINPVRTEALEEVGLPLLASRRGGYVPFRQRWVGALERNCSFSEAGLDLTDSLAKFFQGMILEPLAFTGEVEEAGEGQEDSGCLFDDHDGVFGLGGVARPNASTEH